MNEIPGNVFPRRLDAPLPVAVRAEGMWIEDDRGNRYLDASGGALVVNLGHGRPEIASAVHDQVFACDYTHPTMFTTPAVETLARDLARHAPPGIERFYFLSGGGEAVETAIKLARQIHLACDRPQRFRLIARWKSYHGLSLGALSATGRTSFRAPFAPMLPETIHIPAPYCLRCALGLSYPDCGVRCAHALEAAVLDNGPETIAAFLAETVSGATIAAVPPPPEYFPIIREICDRYNVLLILDEVLCGMGRTGRWFASEHYGVAPDLVTLGKGLSGGNLPLSAVGVQSRHFEAVRTSPAGFVHGGTFSHHGPAAAAGVAAIRILEQEKLVERVARYGEGLGRKLKERLSGHRHVCDIRGIGFLWGIELARDKQTKEPFPRREKVTERIWSHLFRQGIIVYKSTGLAGIDGDALVVGPPFIIREEEMDMVAEGIGRALDEVLG